MKKRTKHRHGAIALWIVLAALALALPLSANDDLNSGTANGEWRYWGGDEAASRHSPLDQINAENFGDLEVVWRWKAANYGPEVDHIYRSTPIYVKGRLYTVAGQRRTVVCIDPATGETLWMWRPKPNPRWEMSSRKNDNSWEYTGNVSSWTPLAADSQRGLVFIDTDAPTNDYYGGDRKGDNLFGTSLIALDVKTGKRVWHYQIVHHDIWNYDNPDAPKALDVNINGKKTHPMTYMHNGRQYIVLSVADPDVPAEHVAVALPE